MRSLSSALLKTFKYQVRVRGVGHTLPGQLHLGQSDLGPSGRWGTSGWPAWIGLKLAL